MIPERESSLAPGASHRRRRRLWCSSERPPLPLREAMLDERSMRHRTQCFVWWPVAVPHPVAPAASRGNVARVSAAFAPRNNVLGGCLKPARLSKGQAMPRGEIGHVIEPHWGITVEAKAALFGESGTTQTNHDGKTHGRHSAIREGVPRSPMRLSRGTHQLKPCGPIIGGYGLPTQQCIAQRLWCRNTRWHSLMLARSRDSGRSEYGSN